MHFNALAMDEPGGFERFLDVIQHLCGLLANVGRSVYTMTGYEDRVAVGDYRRVQRDFLGSGLAVRVKYTFGFRSLAGGWFSLCQAGKRCQRCRCQQLASQIISLHPSFAGHQSNMLIFDRKRLYK